MGGRVNNEGNANQNYNHYNLTPVWMAIISKTRRADVDEDMKREHCTVGGNVSWCSDYEKEYEGSL